MDGGPSLESPARECAAVVGLAFGIDRPVDVEHSLEELRGLAAAAGVTVVLQVLQERRQPDPALSLGPSSSECGGGTPTPCSCRRGPGRGRAP